MEGPEFHHSLVVKAWLLAVEEFVGELGKELLSFININRCVDVVEPGQHAVDVAVDHGVGQVEGYGCDGCSGVVADAFQQFELFKIGRKLSIILFYNLLRAVVQVAGTRVVA